MKRLNNIFEKITSIENLELACKKATKSDSKQDEVDRFYNNKETLLLKLQSDLITKKFTTSKYKVYKINDKGKERTIHDLPFYPDRIVHWAIMLQIEDMFCKNFIKNTYAAIPNKGGHLALSHIKKEINRNKDDCKFCLKLDIKKYFPSINQQTLSDLIKRKIKDKDLLWLLDDIVFSLDKGLPIGNYTSQYFGNFYLSAFDHWCKEELKIKHFFRYMDDIVVLAKNKKILMDLFFKIQNYLNQNLSLEIKNNWQIFSIKIRGIDFVGFRIFPKYVLLRKSILKRFKRKSNGIKKHLINTGNITYNMICTLFSYYGWLKWCNGYKLKLKYIDTILNNLEVLNA